MNQLPAELKIQIFNLCDLPSKICMYDYLLDHDKELDIKYLNIMNDKLINKFSHSDIESIIKTDNTDYFIYLLHKIPKSNFIKRYFIVDNNVIERCFSNGSCGIIRYFLSTKIYSDLIIQIGKDLCYLSIKNNNINILKLLTDHGIKWDSRIFFAAAEANNLELFDYFRMNNLGIYEELFINNRRVNQEILLSDEFLTNNCYIRKYKDEIYNSIAKHGNIQFLEYMYQISPPVNITLSSSLLNFHISVIKWSITKFIPIHKDYCYKAAQSGNLDNLKWLRKNGCTWDLEVLQCAYKSGNLELFLYVIKKFNVDVLNIKNFVDLLDGISFDIIKYLFQLDIEIPIEVLYKSCSDNNFEVFKYYIEMKGTSGVNPTILEPKIISKQNYIDYLTDKKYIFRYTYELCYITGDLYELGKLYKDIAMGNVEKIYELFLTETNTNSYKSMDINDYIMTTLLTKAISHKNYHFIKWYVDKGIHIYDKIINILIKENYADIFAYCIEHGYKFTSSNIDNIMLLDRLEFFIIIDSSSIDFGRHLNNCLNIYKYLYNNKRLKFDLPLYSRASDEKRTDIIEWLNSINYPNYPMNDSLFSRFRSFFQ